MHKKLLIILCIMINCFDINTLVARTQESALSITEIDTLAYDLLKQFNVPGAAVGIVIDDQTILTRGYGTRKVDEDLPVTENTLFPIASCTKAFTALLLGQLLDEEKIALDDPVKKYIPEFCLMDQDRTLNLTIRDLLAHRTGIARHDPIWISSEIPRSEIIGLFKHLEPACDLRQEFQYNNLMYAIAGILTERVTGQSWEEAIDSRLLRPLKMKNSNTSIKQLQTYSDFSYPHAELDGVVTTVPFCNFFSMNPAGGINSTILEMVNWLKLQLSEGEFLNKSIITQQTLKETHAIQILLPPNENEEINQIGYGLGWFIGKYRGCDFISHGGDIDGFCTEVALLPEKRLGIVILTNSSTDGRYVIHCIRNKIIDKVLGIEDTHCEKKIKDIHSQAKSALNEALKIFNEAARAPSTHPLEAYVGQYHHPAYGNIEITIENNNLSLSYGKLKTPLYFKSDGIFTVKFSGLLVYGINPIVDLTFFKDSVDHVCKIQIPFESFRSAKPITFFRKSSI